LVLRMFSSCDCKGSNLLLLAVKRTMCSYGY
jgi:hypothetical protein